MTEVASTPAPTAGSTQGRTPVEVVTVFFDAYRRRDVEAMTDLCTENADFSYIPFEVWAKQRVMRGDGKVRSVLVLGQVVVAEVKIEGTQAADFLGVLNQEKHLDVDSAWRFTVTGEEITGIDVYWCQNQLLRRLAVKRTDQIAIV